MEISTGWPGFHFIELGFLEVGDNPEIIADQRQQLLAGLQVSALFHRAAGDAAVFRRIDNCVVQIVLGVFQRCLGAVYGGGESGDFGFGAAMVSPAVLADFSLATASS